jgi:thiol:disulfide interchange protein DsbD
LALAFKFLSNADLVQLHFLKEKFPCYLDCYFWNIGILFIGKITLPHDSPLTHISVGRLLFGLLVLSFTIYLIPGLWGAPLKLINAFPLQFYKVLSAWVVVEGIIQQPFAGGCKAGLTE